MLRNKRGFTLIEVTIVLAIMGAMIPMVFVGQRELRQNAQFTDSMDRLKNQLQGVKNEANTTVNAVGSGTDQDIIVQGNLVEFTDSSRVLIHMRTRKLSTNQHLVAQSRSWDIPWGTRFQAQGSTGTRIFFARNFNTGELKTFVMDDLEDAADQSCASIPQFIIGDTLDCQNGGNEAVYVFKDASGKTGRLFVNAKDGGTVRWEIE